MKKTTVKRIQTMLMVITMIFVLCACGSSGANTTTAGLVDNANKEQGLSNTNETSGAQQDNSNRFEMTYPRESDEKYFSPASDDYVYILRSLCTDDGYGGYYENIELISFDNEGNVIQYIEKDCQQYFTTEYFVFENFAGGKEYEPYHTWVGDVIYIDHFNKNNDLFGGDTSFLTCDTYLTTKAEVFIQANEDRVLDRYFSKPNDNMLKTIDITIKEDELFITKYVDMKTDDYVVRAYDLPSPDATDNHYREERICFYDEKGECIKSSSVNVFYNANDAKSSFEKYNPKYKKDMILQDNVIVFTMCLNDSNNPVDVSDEYKTEKVHLFYPDMEKTYYSKPYLTQEQFDYYVSVRNANR